MTLQADEIETWLNANPDFFQHRPELLNALALPHPDTGQAVSLVERQLLSLRERNRALEARLAELIQIARENDALSAKVQAFSLRLLQQRDPAQIVDAVTEGLREGFRVPHVAVRVWAHGTGRPGGEERQPVLEELQSFASSLAVPVCGSHPVYEINRWFGEDGPRLRSFALAALGQPAIGLLVLASEDPERFYSGMGTAYLGQLAAMAGAALLAAAVPGDDARPATDA